MLLDPIDTIVALSTASGPGARAIVRLTGPSAVAIAQSLTSTGRLPNGTKPDGNEPDAAWSEPVRTFFQADLNLPGIAAALPADFYFWSAPRTYTGQDLVEIHTLSSPPLVELLIAECLRLGARAAQPGEFTMRAFLAGKLDLTQAEAVLGVIEADNPKELHQALTQLAGGASQPLHQLRDDLLSLLADVEAGLDFTEEDIQFVQQRQLLDRIAHALAHLTIIRKQMELRAVAQRPFRVVLAGRANAGKSTLFNALLRRTAALVSADAGTTRDYLEGDLHFAGLTLKLVDTAGQKRARIPVEREAQRLREEQMEAADLVIWCAEAKPGRAEESDDKSLPDLPSERLLKAATKCDLAAASPDWRATSAVTGLGLLELKQAIVDFARARRLPPLAPSLSRCRHHVDACLSHLRQAHGIVLHEDPAELLAVELRGALDELGAMVGAIYTDDLLDRIFSRFCIGK